MSQAIKNARAAAGGAGGKLGGLYAIAQRLGVDPRTPEGRARIKQHLGQLRMGRVRGGRARGLGVTGLRRRGRRGITATELRGFRKVASLLNRYFRSAPAAMKRMAFGKKGRRR